MSTYIYSAFTMKCKPKFAGLESYHGKCMGSRNRTICAICNFSWKNFCKNHLAALILTFLICKWQIFGIQEAVVTILGAQMRATKVTWLCFAHTVTRPAASRKLLFSNQRTPRNQVGQSFSKSACGGEF